MKLKFNLNMGNVTVNDKKLRYAGNFVKGGKITLTDHSYRKYYEIEIVDIKEINKEPYHIYATVEAEIVKDYQTPSDYYEVIKRESQSYMKFYCYADDLETAIKYCDTLEWGEVVKIENGVGYQSIVYKKEIK